MKQVRKAIIPAAGLGTRFLPATKALAKELGPSGITVNCLTPGVITTEMNSHLSEEDLAILAEETPLNSLGSPEDIAEMVAFLASDKAKFITGQIIGINGSMVI